MAFSSDNRRFYTPGRQNEILSWDVSSGQYEIMPINLTNKEAKAIDINRDGTKLAIGTANGLVVCDPKGRGLFQTVNAVIGPRVLENKDRLSFGGHYCCAQFSPNGQMLAVVASESPDTIRLLDSDRGQELHTIKLESWLVRMAFSPNSEQIVATERDSAVRLYDVKN